MSSLVTILFLFGFYTNTIALIWLFAYKSLDTVEYVDGQRMSRTACANLGLRCPHVW